MKKTLIALLLVVPVCLGAKSNDDSKYLVGAVPEENGQIVFRTSFHVSGKTTEEIKATLEEWANALVDASIPAPGTYARIMGVTDTSIVARVCEWMVFKKKPLYLDRTRFRFQLDIEVEGDHVGIAASGLTYYYSEDMETENGQLIKAEEWISDSEALNKAGTKLYPKSGKFRRFTVDRMEALFASAMEALAEKEEVAPEAAPAAPPAPKGITLD